MYKRFNVFINVFKASYSHELRPRKSSQPVLGFHGNESRSNEKDRMKESNDPIRIIDASL